MTIYIFTGPTLAPAEAQQVLDATYLPPAAQGDVYRVARLKPHVIGIIDGYFDTMPSVWHKEILWAMHEGVHVFGSASMGALRAAELDEFGMDGVGKIFEAYCRGELEDDDEVAVAHTSAEHGYHSFSVAMVNLRATFAAAQAQNIISSATREALVQIAKELFYPERTYPRVLEAAAEKELDPAQVNQLKQWLPHGQIDQKREDALAMLRVIRQHNTAGLKPKRVRYHFQHTIYWEHLCATAGEFNRTTDAREADLSPQLLLDEARLNPKLYRLAHAGAANRALGLTLAGQQDLHASTERVQEAIAHFRRAQRLLAADQVTDWLKANELDATDLTDLMEEAELTRVALQWAAPNLTSRVVDELKLNGAFPKLAERARDKQRVLAEAGLANGSLEDAGLTREQLMEWYFQVYCGTRVPLDIREHVSEAGFRDEYFFIRALLREFCYLQQQNAGGVAQTH